MASAESFQLDDCSFSFSMQGNYDHPRIFRNINLKVTHPELGHVGSLYAVKILRHLCENAFLEVMDDHSDELQQFSLALFDKFGRVKPWLYQPGNRRGTGAWGKELDNSTIVYVLNAFVNDKLRGKGLGSKMIESLLASKYVETGTDTLMCWPEPATKMEQNEYEELKRKQVNFFRKNGFRRVGRTGFFGYSTDPVHPSHAIPLEEDVTEIGGDNETNGFKIKGLSKEEIANQYPLHFAITNTKGQDVADTIKSYHETNPASIHETDAYGYTPIHIALCVANPDAVRVLLELGVKEDMKNTNNVEGTTPFESLTATMESSRTFSETVLGEWKGYENKELECEFLMKRAMGESTMSDTLEEYIAKRKFGCTCGICAGGWLSKRMRFRLYCGAEEAREMMDDALAMGLFKNHVPCSDPDMLVDCVSDYLPPHLYSSIYETFYIGWQSIFTVIADFLDRTGQPLSTDTIVARSASETSAKFFFEKGGQVVYAFDALTDGALQQSPLGDGFFEQVWQDQDVWIKLPRCENDLEFNLVRQMLGLTRNVRWGPYHGMMCIGSYREKDDESDSEESDEDGKSMNGENIDEDDSEGRKTDESVDLSLPPIEREEFKRLMDGWVPSFVRPVPTNFGLDRLD
ncbi:Proteasome subunit alpha type-4 [Termitomyces sp. T112]|nr:Proteasome subunit alpha type-4 [Termitomyces sp. T112]